MPNNNTNHSAILNGRIIASAKNAIITSGKDGKYNTAHKPTNKPKLYIEVLGLGAAYNLEALNNIQINKLQANNAGVITFNCGINALKNKNAKAGV